MALHINDLTQGVILKKHNVKVHHDSINVARVRLESVSSSHKQHPVQLGARLAKVIDRTAEIEAAKVNEGLLTATVNITEGLLTGLGDQTVTLAAQSGTDLQLPAIPFNPGQACQKVCLGMYSPQIVQKMEPRKATILRLRAVESQGEFDVQVKLSGRIIQQQGYEMRPAEFAKLPIVSAHLPNAKAVKDDLVWTIKGTYEYKVDYSQ